MPPGSQFRLRLRRRIEKLRGTIFSFKKHTKDGRCFWAEYFFEVFWRLPLKPKSRKNISSKVGKVSNYRSVEGSDSKVRPGLNNISPGFFFSQDFFSLKLFTLSSKQLLFLLPKYMCSHLCSSSSNSMHLILHPIELLTLTEHAEHLVTTKISSFLDFSF